MSARKMYVESAFYNFIKTVSVLYLHMYHELMMTMTTTTAAVTKPAMMMMTYIYICMDILSLARAALEI